MREDTEQRPSKYAKKALSVSLLALLLTAGSAQGAPYEPNNSTLEAWGPLLAGQSYNADLPAQDSDFYFFYVTAADPPPIEIRVANVGGGTLGSNIDLSIVDAVGSPIAAEPFIGPGETRTLTVGLTPGKYYVEVSSKQGYADSYVLTPVSGSGNFALYMEIAGRCDSARLRAGTARTALHNAQSRFQRTVARRRWSRYAGAHAQRRARRIQARALSRLKAARRRQRAANAALSPWCSIPQ